MKQNNKPKIGLALLCSDWFLDVGIGGREPGDTSVVRDAAMNDAHAVFDTLSPFADLVYPGVIYSEDAAISAARRFIDNEVSGIVLVHLFWSSDMPLMKFLNGIGDIPLLLWCYSPYKTLPESSRMLDIFRGTGAVGIMQGSALMRKLGTKFSFAFGTCNDETLVKRLKAFCTASAAFEAIKKLRIGYVGPRCECMTGTYVDEFRLLSKLGPKLVYISPFRLYELSKTISDEELNTYINWLTSTYSVREVSDLALKNASIATLSIEKAVIEENLDIISVEDLNIEMLNLLKARPHLWTQTFSNRGTVITMEADVVSALGLWLSQFISGNAAMYAEAFNYDETENALLLGHATMHNVELAGDNPITIIPDREYENTSTPGAWLHFTAKPGSVLLCNVFADNNNYRIFTCSGEVLPYNKHKDGFTTAFVKLDVPVKEFYEKAVCLGMTQHNSVCYGDIEEALRLFCEIADIKYVSCEE